MNKEPNNQFLGRRALINRNEFIDYDSLATIIRVSDNMDAFLLELDQQVIANNRTYKLAIARRRSATHSPNEIQRNCFPCNITWASETDIRYESPFDLSWWRGGAAAITDLVLVEPDHPQNADR